MSMGSDIKDGLNTLLEELPRRDCIIVPIARRGVRTLQLSTMFEELLKNGRILLYDTIAFHAKELKKKKIVIFDEAANTGKTLERLRSELQQFSQKNGLNFENKVYTAALFVNREAEYYPNYYYYLLSSHLYDRFNKELDYLLLSKGEPMDVDHMIGKIELLEPQSKFLEILHNDYDAIKNGHSREYEDVLMFDVDFTLPNRRTPFEFNIPSMDGLPRLFDEGPRKLRIYIKGNLVHLVPVVYPAMEINENITKQPETCPLLKKIKTRALCKVIANGTEKKQHILCYNCIVNELCIDLLTLFLVDLSQRIKFNYIGLDDISLQVISHDESVEVVKRIEEEIRNSIESGRYVPLINGKPAEKCEFKGVSYNNDVPTIQGNYIKLELDNEKIGLRPEVEISIAVNENKDVNKKLFKKGEYSEFPKGLSYSQIRELMKNIDERSFSDGMDVALDVGYLKPMNIFNGMEVYAGGHRHRAIVRVYTTAGEDVEKSLKCFLRLITPRG